MSKADLFNYFYTNSLNLGVKTIMLVMLAAVAMCAVIAVTYYLSYRGTAYNSKFNQSLVLLTLISTVIMMMISSNIVVSLGMVGALSIIRFRTAIKDSRDTVFLFWAITEGLCLGSQNFKLAACSTLFMAIVLLAMSFAPRLWHQYLLVVTGEQTDIDMRALLDLLQQHTVWYKLRTVNQDNQRQELIFSLVAKQELPAELSRQILAITGATSANLVMQTGETLG